MQIYKWPKTKRCHVPENPYNTNKFELIFDESIDGAVLKEILKIDQLKLEDYSEDDVCDDD